MEKDGFYQRRHDDARLNVLELKVRELELNQAQLTSNQKEHRAILIGDELEGRGGLRKTIYNLTEDMRKRFARQNVILYVIIVLGLLASPPHVKEIAMFIGKLFAP